MKKYFRFLLLAALLPTFVMVGCKDTPDDPDTDAYTLLKDHLVADSLDLPKLLTDWVATTSGIGDSAAGTAANHYVIDIRSSADFALGHIKGSVNTTLTNVVTQAASNGGKPIVVVCYSGQTAGVAVMALRLSGYPTAKILKWGMSGWNSAFDKWTSKTSSQAVGHANWTNDPVAGDQEYGNPTLVSTNTTGEDILKERIDTVLARGLQNITGADALANPGNYFLNNFWAAADVTTYGHIVGAHRIMPLSISGGEIKKLDPSKTIVTYCWTGQTSAMVSTFLNILGYNAKGIGNGANNMIYSQLTGPNKWIKSADYNYEQ
jgi:rhodanese-related sulfurtransferase